MHSLTSVNRNKIQLKLKYSLKNRHSIFLFRTRLDGCLIVRSNNYIKAAGYTYDILLEMATGPYHDRNTVAEHLFG